MLKILKENQRLKHLIPSLRYRGATLFAQKNEVFFYFVSNRELLTDEIALLDAELKAFAFGGYEFCCQVQREDINEIKLRELLFEFIKKRFYAVYAQYKEKGCGITKREKDGETYYEVVFSADDKGAAILAELGFEQSVADYIEDTTFARASVSIKIVETDFDLQAAVKEIEKKQTMLKLDILSRPDRSVRMKKTAKMTPMEVNEKPCRISDIASTGIKVTVCGEVDNLNIKDFRNTGKKFDYLVSGALKDFSGSISFVHFIRGNNLYGWDLLPKGAEVVIYGRVSEDNRGVMNIIVTAANMCEIVKQDKARITPKEDYLLVKPNMYSKSIQQDLFSLRDSSASECLKGKAFTVFDFETTGLNPKEDRVIEIGAVRIIDGVIQDEFSTFVNPEIHIPQEASRVNGIKDEDVAEQPKFAHVAGDFYKYCYGSILIAHNAAFDASFLVNEASRVKYEFDNPTLDTIAIAKAFFGAGQTGGISPPKDYRLKKLAIVFGIDFELQHRALADARATAELFLKIAEINPEIIKKCLKTLA